MSEDKRFINRSLNVWVRQDDFDKLRALADDDYRSMREQASFILRAAIREKYGQRKAD